MVGGAAGEAEVGVALAHGQVARALLGVALRLAAAAGEAVLTFGKRVLVICGPCGSGSAQSLDSVGSPHPQVPLPHPDPRGN